MSGGRQGRWLLLAGRRAGSRPDVAAVAGLAAGLALVRAAVVLLGEEALLGAGLKHDGELVVHVAQLQGTEGKSAPRRQNTHSRQGTLSGTNLSQFHAHRGQVEQREG